MSVYVVTRDQRILRYDSPQGNIWLRMADSRWHIYYKTCTCSECDDDKHRHIIAYVDPSQVTAIGFNQPVVVAARLLTQYEKQNLISIREWLTKHGPIKRKLNAAVLDVVTK